MKDIQLQERIIFWGRELHRRGLVVGCTGNISARCGEDEILLTAHNGYLGYLEAEEIIEYGLSEGRARPRPSPERPDERRGVTTELPMHLAAYNQPNVNVVIHAHPVWTTAFYVRFASLDIFSYEARLYLANIPVIPQDGPVVTDVEPVQDALKTSNIVVLKNHGVVSVGENFKQAFSLIEMLEENCRVGLQSVRGSECPSAPEDVKEINESNNKKAQMSYSINSGNSATPQPPNPKTYILFSPQHIRRIVDLVNEDEYIREKGAALDLTTHLAIKIDDDGRVYNFHFNKGHIDEIVQDENALFVISGPLSSWQMVFAHKLDPFAAVTQKRLRLKGDMARLSRWYAPFSRIFELWKMAPISV